MKICDFQIYKLRIPLKSPFKTALRTVYVVEDVVVRLVTHAGLVGFGSASPTMAITGESFESIVSCLKNHCKHKILGFQFDNMESIFLNLHSGIVRNTAAISAVDMALYDLWAQNLNLPLFRFLGGFRKLLFSDITISANCTDTMIADSLIALEDGFSDLKIKLGKDPKHDVEKLKMIRRAVGDAVNLSVDANQAWNLKEAFANVSAWEKDSIRLEFVEQPVLAKNIEDLAFLKNNLTTKILVDESVFSPADALYVVNRNAADMINIKLAKSGGIYQAQKIIHIAEAAGLSCVVGCMMESQIALNAAAHFAAAFKCVSHCDLDPFFLLEENPIVGGVSTEANMISLPEEPGLAIRDVLNLEKVA